MYRGSDLKGIAAAVVAIIFAAVLLSFFVGLAVGWSLG